MLGPEGFVLVEEFAKLLALAVDLSLDRRESFASAAHFPPSGDDTAPAHPFDRQKTVDTGQATTDSHIT
jgi:hypothetical protein